MLPQLQGLWNLSPGVPAWLTTAAQIGSVYAANASSLPSLLDIVELRRVILGGAIAAVANALPFVAAPARGSKAGAGQLPSWL